MSENDCVFCRLLSGAEEVTVIREDDRCVAFMDVQPINPGHALVVPRKHAPYLADLEAEDGAQMFRVAQRVAAALRECGVKCEGINFFLADGEAAGQEVFHAHLHVFPRYRGDNFGLKLPPDYQDRPPREELNDIAQRIKWGIEKADL
jgi:histidine triad (HIT) family protein